MWSFFILSLQVCFEPYEVQDSCQISVQFPNKFFNPLFQAMIIMACHDLGSPLEVFDAEVFEDVMSIFITSAILNLIRGMRTCYYSPGNDPVGWSIPKLMMTSIYGIFSCMYFGILHITKLILVIFK